MDQKAARTAAGKAFKARGVALKKGHWRLGDPKKDPVVWYVDLRADRAGPTAPLSFEIGAWVAALGQPEPEGGAVDCPLLFDRPLPIESAEQVTATVDALVDEASSLASATALSGALRGDTLDGALVDKALRTLLS